MSHKVEAFFDKKTCTLTYIVYNEDSQDAVIIDSVLDYDPISSKVSFESVEKVIEFIKSNNLNALFVLDTHIHADHMSGSAELKKRIPGLKNAIGKNVIKVQERFNKVYNFKNFNCDGNQFDLLLTEEEILRVGTIEIKTIFTPGHTPSCSSYLIGDTIFTGDALFMPDDGTGRCDFPDGSAEELYDSIFEKLYQLPDKIKVFTGHIYSNKEDLKYESTITEQKETNIRLRQLTTKEEFVQLRNGRDSKLTAPKLLLPSIQVNINGGVFPETEENGVHYLKIPVRFN